MTAYFQVNMVVSAVVAAGLKNGVEEQEDLEDQKNQEDQDAKEDKRLIYFFIYLLYRKNG